MHGTSNRLILMTMLIIAGVRLGAQNPGAPAVADAAEQRKTSQVLALIQRHSDVNQPQADGGTALHWAAHWDDRAMAEALLKAGAKANVANDYGVTPLFMAAENGNAEMIALLVKAEADPNAALATGETVLMAAVRGGKLAAVKQLLDSHANPNAAQASQNQTALMWAAADARVDLVNALLDAGADVHAASKAGSTPLMFAARTGNIEIVKRLIAAGDKINASSKDGSTPLSIATVKGHPALALFLLEQGADPDGNFKGAGYTPLMWAVGTFDPISVAYKGVHVDGEWATFAGIPDRAGKIRLVKALIDRGAAVDARLTKNIPELNPNNGAGNKPPHLGATPFVIAAQSADAEMMRLLVAYGADPLAHAVDGQTALMAACEGIVENTFQLTEDKRIAAAQVAMDLGVGLEDQDNRGFRAMHVAARAGYHEVIKYLVSKGAEKNPQTKAYTSTYGLGQVQLEGQTPLGMVEGTVEGVYYARPETAAFLRELGGFKSIGRYIVTAADRAAAEKEKAKTATPQ